MFLKQYFHAENDDLSTSIDVETFENGAKIIASNVDTDIVIYLAPNEIKELTEKQGAFVGAKAP